MRKALQIFVTLALASLCPAVGMGQNDNIVSESVFENLSEDAQARLAEKYEAQLNAVLMTRRLEERAYIEQVVQLVADQKLPKRIVDSSWLWIRKNRPNTRNPFVYFERILRLQAEKLGFDVPRVRSKRLFPTEFPAIVSSARNPNSLIKSTRHRSSSRAAND